MINSKVFLSLISLLSFANAQAQPNLQKKQGYIASRIDGTTFLILPKDPLEGQKILNVLNDGGVKFKEYDPQAIQLTPIIDPYLMDVARELQNLLGGKVNVQVLPVQEMELSLQAGGSGHGGGGKSTN